LLARHVYLDANIVIEAYEGLGSCASGLSALFALIEAGTVLATTSEWTLAEVLVRPLSIGAMKQAGRYQALLSSSGRIAIEPVSRAILVAAAHICAETRMPMPDCIHVASAVKVGCDVFLTNDRGIVLPSEMERVSLGDADVT
jgi:predicted nucleic acid-binding protein